MATTLPVTQIRRDGGTQARSGLDNNTLLDYRQAIQESGGNWPFPPIIVFYDGKDYWLADGFHRVQAAFSINSGYEVPADVRQGDQRDAKLFAAGANADHGLRRSNDDKRRAVLMLLDDPEWSKWSDREIARRCKVDHKFVGKLRKDVTGDIPSDERTYVTKHGTVATMKTKNIGSNGSQPEPPPPPADEVITAWLTDHPEENPEYVLNHILQYARKFDPDQHYNYSQLSKAAAMLLDMPDVLTAVSVIHETSQAKQPQYYDPPDWFEDYDGLICDCGGDRKVVSLGYPAPPQKNYFKTSCLDCGEQLTWHQPTEIVMRDEPPTENPYRDNVDRSGLLLPPRDESEPFEHHPSMMDLFEALHGMKFEQRDRVVGLLKNMTDDDGYTSKPEIACYQALMNLVKDWKAIIRYYDTLA